jgi:hypothetical protein
MLSGLGGEKSIFRPFIINKFSGLRTFYTDGHEVVLPLVQFVGLPRR